MNNGSVGNIKGVLKWGGLLLYTAVSAAWFVLSLTLQAANDQLLLGEVADQTKAILEQLCSKLHSNGDAHVWRELPDERERCEASLRSIRKATDQVWVCSAVGVLVSGVPETWRAACPLANYWANPAQGDSLDVAFRNQWGFKRNCGDFGSVDQDECYWVRAEIRVQGGAEGRPARVRVSRSMVGCVGGASHAPSGSYHGRDQERNGWNDHGNAAQQAQIARDEGIRRSFRVRGIPSEVGESGQ